MLGKGATALIMISKLLESVIWCFFQEGEAPANIRLEPTVVLENCHQLT